MVPTRANRASIDICGFVLCRTLGIIIGGAPNPFIAAFLVGEIVGLAVALVLLRQVTRGNGA